MNQLIGFYKGLGKRERILALMFIGAIAGSVYYHSLYKPFLLTARRYKQQAERLETRIHEVESDAPEILAKEERVKGLNKQCALLLDEIQDIEKKLPSKSTTSRLVGELARLAKDLRLDSIRQRIDDGDEYSRIFVEMKFDASYKETVRFIKRVETISPFLNIEEFEIIEPHKAKKRQGVGTSTRVVISSVLGEMPFADRLKAQDIKDMPLEFRDVFVSNARPAAPEPEYNIKLGGITYNKEFPTTIINGEVAKEGSRVGDLTVKKIFPNSVLLTDGLNEFTLTLDR